MPVSIYSYDVHLQPALCSVVRTVYNRIISGDVTDSTGMVQALVARRRARLRHQRQLYNNWQTTKLSFRSLSS